MKKRIIIFLILIIPAILVGWDFQYPGSWDQVTLGMTKAEVVDLFGNPDYERSEKGAFWIKNGIGTVTELHMYFEVDNKAVIVSIERRIGSTEKFFRQTLHFDIADRTAF